MAQDLLLLIHNFGYSTAAIILLFVVIIIYTRNKTELSHKLLMGAFLSVAVFMLSHLFGVNTTDPAESRLILMFTLGGLPSGILLTHAILAYFKKDRALHAEIAFFYTTAAALIIFFVLYPNSYLHLSLPDLYFPSYYNAGNLYPLIVYFNLSLAAFLLFELWKIFSEADPLQRNRIYYFLAAYLLGIASALVAYPAGFEHPVQPSWGGLMVPIFAVMFAYSFLKHEPVDIRILIRNFLIYAVLIICTGGFIMFFNILSNVITEARPNFPPWLLPLVSSSAAVAVGFFVWNEFRKGEQLKYEFISVVTNKFRNPLTNIKWASENLSSRPRNDDDQAQIAYITSANLKLIELTDLLITVSDAENTSYSYKFERVDLSQIVDEVISSLQVQIQSRKTKLTKNLEPGLLASLDERRMRFVLQTLIENAVNYTPIGGDIVVTAKREGALCQFSVKDTGIGIAKAELPLLFSKFYRGKKAMLTDTEGMGIGLYIAKEIVSQHNGRVWAESEGEGTGSTFSFTLPAII
jgi:signal transduction histidine kinase